MEASQPAGRHVGSVAIGSFVLVLWLGFAIISAWLAFRFGYGRAVDISDRRLYGSLGVLVDLTKSVLPLCAVFAYLQHERFLGAVLWVVFGLFTTFSLIAALGFAAEHLAARERVGSDEASVAADIRRMEARLVELGPVRGASVVEKAVEAAYAQPSKSGGGVGALSKRCTRELLVTREACAAIAVLEVELAGAREADSLRVQLADARRERDRVGEQRGAGDQQVEILSLMSRLPQDFVRTSLAVMLAVVIELGSGLLLYVGGTQVMGPGWHHRVMGGVASRAASERPQKDDVVANVSVVKAEEQVAEQQPERVSASATEYMLARVDYGAGDVSAPEVYEDYLVWCGELGLEPRGRAGFSESFLMLAMQAGIPRRVADEVVVYRNIRLGPVAAPIA